MFQDRIIFTFILNWGSGDRGTKPQYFSAMPSSVGCVPLLCSGEHKCFLRSRVVEICCKSSPFAPCLLLLSVIINLWGFSLPGILSCLLHLSKIPPPLCCGHCLCWLSVCLLSLGFWLRDPFPVGRLWLPPRPRALWCSPTGGCMRGGWISGGCEPCGVCAASCSLLGKPESCPVCS